MIKQSTLICFTDQPASKNAKRSKMPKHGCIQGFQKFKCIFFALERLPIIPQHQDSRALVQERNDVLNLEFILGLYNQLFGKNEVQRKRSIFQKVLSKDFTCSNFVIMQKRKRLVQMIINEGLSLSKVSKKLKLKLTTARLILKKYMETGNFPMRNFKKKGEKNEKKDELKTFEKELQESQIQSVQEKEEEYEDVIIEQPPIICYYFVSQMPALTCLPQFWPGYTQFWV